MASAVASLQGASGNERFNAEAAAWDQNPFVHEASKEAANAIIQRFSKLEISGPHQTLDVLEIGCGTGLLSLQLAPFVRTLVAIDAAQGMIDVLTKKLQGADAPKNVLPLCVLLEDPEDRVLPPATSGDNDGPRMKFDLILSHLVLHHIPDLEGVLKTMLGRLNPGGSVALTDFEDFGPEARRFHPKAKMAGVERHGIGQETMTALMQQVGFKNVRVERAFAMMKQVETIEGEFGSQRPAPGQGEVMNFPFLVCMGER